MKKIVSFLTVYILGISAYSQKSCSDCTSIRNCPAGLELVNTRNSDSDQRLKNAFCGFGDDQLPKMCCSELNEVEDLENHPNVRLLPEKCGPTDGDRIIGGKTAGLYEFPWMALISHNTRLGLQFQCGGSIINERYVLTAAHCIVNQKIAGVRIGEHDVRTQEDCQGQPPKLVCESNIQDMPVEKEIVHPDYQGKPNVKNDIGLLRLKKPVDFSFKNAFPICLPTTNALRNSDISNENATIAGWGYTESGYVSPVMLTVKVPVYTKQACAELYEGKRGSAINATLNKLCAGTVGKDSCGGDSGGPLMVKGVYNNVHRYIQHGIVSYGPKLCGSSYPGVYTDVTKYMKWILDNITP